MVCMVCSWLLLYGVTKGLDGGEREGDKQRETETLRLTLREDERWKVKWLR